jgi:hypothetical protein
VASPGDISIKLKRNIQNNNLKVTYMTSSPADTTNEKPYKKVPTCTPGYDQEMDVSDIYSQPQHHKVATFYS